MTMDKYVERRPDHDERRPEYDDRRPEYDDRRQERRVASGLIIYTLL